MAVQSTKRAPTIKRRHSHSNEVRPRVEPEKFYRQREFTVTDDEELMLLIKAVALMLFLALVAVVGFFLINHFHPQLFLTPVRPR